MKLIIFAGGSGRRLWPISRQATPKQFEPIVGDRSTLQMAVDRVVELYDMENIYISTGDRYIDIVAEQLPALPTANLIGEPTRRDLAAAVGLAMCHAAKAGGADEPVGILWGDNTMKDEATFRRLLGAAERLIRQNEAKIVYMGETPRFANENLGWIELGERLGKIDGQPYYRFKSLSYRPDPEICRQMFANQTHSWNTGYFVTTPRYVLDSYCRHQPEMYRQLQEIQNAIGAANYPDTLYRVYPQIASKSFDDAILALLDADEALTLHGKMGWSDPGSLYALKESVAPTPNENAILGLVKALETKDSLLYNYEEDKLLAVIGLDGVIVVNTEDALLVAHKDHVPLVKQAVNEMIGTELEKYS